MQTVGSELQTRLLIAKIEKPGRAALSLDYDDTLAPFRREGNAVCLYPGACESPGNILAGGRTMVVLVDVRSAEESKSLAESWIKPPAPPLEFFHEWFQRCGGAG
ncbi:MAG: hypothetical protein ACRD23_08685 [Terriglobales bacterium]